MAQPVNSYRYEYWTRTSGDLKDRRTPIDVPHIVSTPGDAVKIVVDPTQEYQMWEGAGAAITDSSASLFMNSMTSEQRHAILTEMFDPEQGGFSSVRMSIGACDFSSQKYYTYDDLPDGVAADAALEHFSIGTGEPGAPDATRDMKNVVPVLQEIVSINPAVKIMASPWSAPAWMKTSNRIDGSGRLRLGEYVGNGYRYQDTIDYVYAQYFVKFIEAYAKLGIHITSVTMQNEPSNGCPWPITVWTPEELTLDETVDEASHVMFGEIGNWLVRHGVGLINLWNIALDEQGFPSYAGTSGRRGVITIDSSTGKVKRNLEYFMLRNYGQDVPVGSRRIGSSNYTPDGRNGGLGSVAFESKRGDLSVIVYNPGGTDVEAAITINGEGARWQKVVVPAYGTVTFHKSDREMNVSTVPEDDEFKITYTPHPADDHDETLF